MDILNFEEIAKYFRCKPDEFIDNFTSFLKTCNNLRLFSYPEDIFSQMYWKIDKEKYKEAKKVNPKIIWSKFRICRVWRICGCKLDREQIISLLIAYEKDIDFNRMWQRIDIINDIKEKPIEDEKKVLGYHGKKVYEIKKIMKTYLPKFLKTTYFNSSLYRPDICFRFHDKFIVVDYVNSCSRLLYDVAGLFLLLQKFKEIDTCIAVLSEEVFHSKLIDDIQFFRNSDRLVILCETQFEGWLMNK